MRLRILALVLACRYGSMLGEFAAGFDWSVRRMQAARPTCGRTDQEATAMAGEPVLVFTQSRQSPS